MGRVAEFDKLNILKQKMYLHFNEQKKMVCSLYSIIQQTHSIFIRILLLNCFGVLLHLLSVYVFQNQDTTWMQQIYVESAAIRIGAKQNSI